MLLRSGQNFHSLFCFLFWSLGHSGNTELAGRRCWPGSCDPDTFSGQHKCEEIRTFCIVLCALQQLASHHTGNICAFCLVSYIIMCNIVFLTVHYTRVQSSLSRCTTVTSQIKLFQTTSAVQTAVAPPPHQRPSPTRQKKKNQRSKCLNKFPAADFYERERGEAEPSPLYGSVKKARGRRSRIVSAR